MGKSALEKKAVFLPECANGIVIGVGIRTQKTHSHIGVGGVFGVRISATVGTGGLVTREVAGALVIMGARAKEKRKEERERSVRVANPDSVALGAFFFATKLQKELEIPVAFIDAP